MRGVFALHIARKRAPSCDASPKHLVRFGVVGDAARLRAGEDQVRVSAVDDVFGEAREDTAHVLERVPARSLQHDGNVDRRRRAGAEQVDAPCDDAARTVSAREGCAGLVAVAGEQPDVLQQLRDRRVVEQLVLRRERIDRGSNDTQALTRNPTGRESLPREDVAVDTLDVGSDELPALFGQGVRGLDTDVAAPHDMRAGLA